MDNNIEKTGLIETVVGIIMDAAPVICVLIIIAWAGRAYAEGYGLFVQKSLDSPGDVQAHSEMVTISEEDAAVLAGRYDFSGGNIENVARKAAVGYVLSGKKAGLDDYVKYCDEERLSGDRSGRRIGF